ncbi:hypothetical protein F0562_009504 [Nyssa sinensis]|uniref:Uncharacterized protein n=1 Tax=Nyssa sinensis TaxID=561372 RepID=A0A5J5A144_9ASTE|nr:hypothetical protein F0562_009504 [Nyssa sinensis]
MSTTKEFKEVLTLRTENLKVHENRRQLFSSTASKESTNPFVRQRPLAARSAASASTSPPPVGQWICIFTPVISKEADRWGITAFAAKPATADGSITRQLYAEQS